MRGRLAAAISLTGDPAAAIAALIAMQRTDATRPVGGSSALTGGFGDRSLALGGPVLRRAGNGCLLAGDLDLTDSDALAQSLDLPQADDADLVLAAYARWGLDAPDHLEGAFAFVLWDPALARLVAVRDRFGIKPLVFHASPRALLLASDMAILAHALPHRPVLNEDWIADFLAGYTSSEVSTAWRGIERLPPAHMLILQHGHVVTRRWWALEPQTLCAADLAPEALREALSRACAQALRGGATASMLSGGLDSSTLSLLAARASDGPLPVFSLRFPDQPHLDEGRFIAPVLAAGRFVAQDINGGRGSPLAEMDAILSEQGQPFSGFGILTNRMMYRAAAAAGNRAIIDGHGGDEVIGSGLWHLETLAARRDWAGLWRLIRPMAAFQGQAGAMRLMAEYVGRHGRRPLRGLARRLVGGAAADPFAWRVLVHADLAARTDLVARVRAAEASLRQGLPPDFASHAVLLTGCATANAFEILDRAAAATGIVPRYPFFDRRVAELCVNRPSAQKIAQGLPRAQLRAAMAGVLPEPVRLRADKVNFLPNIWRGLREDPQGRLAAYADSLPERLAGYVDADRLRQAGRLMRDPAQADPFAAFHLWRAVWLDRWLETQQSAPSRAAPAAIGHPTAEARL